LSKAVKNSDTLELSLELEEPSGSDSPDAGSASLLLDQVPAMAAKLNVLEELLSLQVRDLSFNDFTREILLAIVKVIHSEAGALLEVNHEQGMLFFRAAVGYSSDQVVRYQVPIGKGIAGHVTESKQTFVVSKVKQNKIHQKAIEKAVGFSARNLVAAPILIRGKVFAVLELLNRVGEPDYSEADVDLLNHLCAYAAKVIEIRLMLGWSLQARNSNFKKAS
jgi:GAF domain-containing protein